jgi:hypothetical protein
VTELLKKQMSHLEIHLPTKEEEESPQIYVNKKLVPIASELYRLVQLHTIFNRTAEKEESDMTCQEIGRVYADVNVLLNQSAPKSVKFSVDSKIPLEKNGKMLKVLMSLTAYSENGKPVAFRLRRASDSNPVEGSVIQVESTYPHEYVAHLPFGEGKNRILPREETYILESKYITTYARPIARRFSLSIVYA